MTNKREDIARAIDPDAWGEWKGAPGYEKSAADIQRDRQATALAKADAIIALRPALETGGGEPVAHQVVTLNGEIMYESGAPDSRLAAWQSYGWTITPLFAHPTPVREPEGLRDLLAELLAVVKGECPSLLNEDGGGNANLALRIEGALAQPTPPSPPHAVVPEGLRLFAKAVLRDGLWDGGSLDGADIQDLAEKHGLIECVAFDPEEHDDHHGVCLEPGDDWYVETSLLKQGTTPVRSDRVAELEAAARDLIAAEERFERSRVSAATGVMAEIESKAETAFIAAQEAFRAVATPEAVLALSVASSAGDA